MRRTTTLGNRLLALMLASALAGAIVACGDSEGNDGGDASAPPTSADRGDSGSPGGSTGAGSERRHAAATVRGMYRAFAAGDAKGVCAAMSVDARDQIAKTVIGGSTETPEDRTCEASFAKFVDAAAGSGLLESTQRIEIGDVSVSGDAATVTVGLGQEFGKVALVKEEGDWRFDAAPGAPGSPGVPPESSN